MQFKKGATVSVKPYNPNVWTMCISKQGIEACAGKIYKISDIWSPRIVLLNDEKVLGWPKELLEAVIPIRRRKLCK